MSIISRFYNIVIPTENLKKILNKEELQKILKKRIKSGPIWVDDYLYSEGSMNPMDNEAIIKFWESKGLTSIEIVNGEKHWKDLCLVEFPSLKTNIPCDWIELFEERDRRGIYFNFKDDPRRYLITEPLYIENLEKFINTVFMSKEIITIAGVSLSQKNFPELYSWAKSNPETLKEQLTSIANAWHEGSMVMAAISLESDLEHG